MDFEIKIIQFFQSFSSPAMDIIATIFSYAFSYVSVVIVAILILLFYNKKFALWFCIVQGIAAIVQLGIKFLFARPRPYTTELVRNIYESYGFSFPSGHSVCAMGIALAVGYIFWSEIGSKKTNWIYFGLVIYLLLNFFNRTYLGQHYFTDILGGYMLMFGLCWIALLVIPNLAKMTYDPIIKKKFKRKDLY